MKKIVIQLKKMYDQIDLRYYYKGMNKLPFLIKYQGILYGQENQYIDYSYDKKVVLNDKLYIIINNDKSIIDYNYLLKQLIVNTITSQIEKEDIDTQMIFRYLVCDKNSDYYKNKYRQNLSIAKLLKDNQCIKEYIMIKKQRKKSKIIDLERNIESTYAITDYIELLFDKKYNNFEYNMKLQNIIDILEDPCRLFNYNKYLKAFSVAFLLAEHILSKRNIEYTEVIDDDYLFNFNNLIKEFKIKNNNIIEYKNIHVKSCNIKGEIVDSNIENIINSGDLYYCPTFITFKSDNKLYKELGDFIIKISDNLEIIECKKCFSLEQLII